MPDKLLSGKQAFVREATGLVKQIGAFDSFAMNFAVVNLGVGIVELFTFAAVSYPGSDVITGMTIGLIPVLFWGIAYTFMSIASPRTGGDYVWISRTLGGAIGFMGGWSALIVNLLIIGINANLFSTLFLSQAVLLMGYLTGNTSLEALGPVLATQNWTFILGLLVIVIMGSIAILSVKVTMLIQRILLVLGMIGIFVIIGLYFSSSVQQFTPLFNAHASQFNTSYDKIISAAETAGYAPGFTMAATVMTLPYVSLIYGGFQFNVAAGSETKNVSKTQPIAIMGAAVVGWLLFAIVGFGAYHAFGGDFLSAIGYLQTNAPSQYTLPLTPTLTYLTGILANNVPLTGFIELTFMAWIVIIQIPFLILTPRYIFALSFDRVLPTKLADVSDRFHTPVTATAVTIVAGIAALALDTYTTVFSLLSNITLALTVYWCLAGLSAVIFPYKKKQMFELAPRFVKARIGSVSFLAISGVVTAVFMALASYFAWIPSPLVNNLVIVGIYASGLILYFVIKYVQKSKGIDLKYLFAQIPPE